MLRAFSELAGSLCAQLLGRRRSACSASPLSCHVMELSWLVASPSHCCPRRSLPCWQRLHPDAVAVSHLFLIRRLPNAGREPRRNLTDARYAENSGFEWRKRRRGRMLSLSPASRFSRRWISTGQGEALSHWCTRRRALSSPR